jgi:hypothetical protein
VPDSSAAAHGRWSLMTKAPNSLGANADNKAAAVASHSTDAPDTSTRADRLRRVYDAVATLERQGGDVRPAVLEVVADRVIDGPAAVPFGVIRGRVRATLGRQVSGHRIDRAIDRLVAAGLLSIVVEADSAAHRCRVFGLGRRLLGGGAA